MQFNGKVWQKMDKKIVAYPWTELYRIMDEAYDYSEVIEDLFDGSLFEECKIKVNGIWYNYQGDLISESSKRDCATEELPKQHHDYLKIIKHPLYAVRKQALLGHSSRVLSATFSIPQVLRTLRLLSEDAFSVISTAQYEK